MNFRQFAFNNVFRNFKTYLAYFLSCTFSIMIFFSFAVCIFHPAIMDSGIQVGSTIFMGLSTAEVIIFLFSFMFVLYSLNTFLKVRGKDFGTLMILGISRKQINRMIILENIIIGVLAIITAIVIGLVFSKFFLMIVSAAIKIEISSFYFPIKAIVLTTITFIFLFIVISIIACRFAIKSNIIDLINGLKKPKKEQKTSFILAIISLIIISLGYFVALRGEALGNGYEMYIVVTLVTIGTFLFFSQFTAYIVRAFKKKRKFYFKRTNLLWVSDLSYRLKDNSIMLFIVTIIAAVSFSAIASLYSIKNDQLSRTGKNFPLDFNYISLENNKDEKEHIKDIEESLKKDNLLKNKISINIINEKSSNNSNIYLIKVSDYNRLAELIQVSKVSVARNEALIVPIYPKKSYRKDLVSIKEVTTKEGLKLNVKDVTEKNIFPAGLLQQTLIINDDLYNSMESKNSVIKYYGYKVKDIEAALKNDTYLKEKILGKNFEHRGEYYFLNSPENHNAEKIQGNLMLFIGFFIGVIFFIGAGSFLYFRFYTDLNMDKEKYRNLSKIGITEKEIKKAATVQIAALFFIPYIIATIHTTFALKTLEVLIEASVTAQLLIVLLTFFLVQAIYFMIIRSKYLYEIKKYCTI